MIQYYEQICDLFIKPIRNQYAICDLGNPLIQKIGIRIDFQILNSRNLKIKCSYYKPVQSTNKCVIYLHSLNSSRLQSSSFSAYFLNQGIAFANLDCSGSGKSQGQYVTFGYYQKYDVIALMQHINKLYNIDKFCLWGRSMGGATIFKAVQNYKKDNLQKLGWKIDGIVVDSVFKSLQSMAFEIASDKINLPGILLKAGFMFIKRSIQNRAKIDFKQLDLIQCIKEIKIPLLLFASKEDGFISSKHSEQIYQKYQGQKQLIFINGKHNQIRSQQNIKTALSFCIKSFDKSTKKQQQKNRKVFQSQKKLRTSTPLKLGTSKIYSTQTKIKLSETKIQSQIQRTQASQKRGINLSKNTIIIDQIQNNFYHRNMIEQKILHLKKKPFINKTNHIELAKYMNRKSMNQTRIFDSAQFNYYMLKNESLTYISNYKKSQKRRIQVTKKPIIPLEFIDKVESQRLFFCQL